MFLSARPVQAATRVRRSRTCAWVFLSARPVRAATLFFGQVFPSCFVSIRATRAGRDGVRWIRITASRRFYPRDPCGPRRTGKRFTSRHAAVSIRATRAGRDLRPETFTVDMDWVSIRATRAGRDPLASSGASQLTMFLSARPVRAATSRARRRRSRPCSFYPRDPCGPRHFHKGASVLATLVSIRATRAGRDIGSSVRASMRSVFLSARPVRAATLCDADANDAVIVSIRATRAGRDADTT